MTPNHIVPEWYFLPFYAMLRAVPDKLGGVLTMGGAIVILAFVPWLDTSKVRSTHYRPVYKVFIALLVIDCIMLGYVGGQTPDAPVVNLGARTVMDMTDLGRVLTLYYFAHFLVVLPLLGLLETPTPRPASIAQAILHDTAGAPAMPMGAHAAPERKG